MIGARYRLTAVLGALLVVALAAIAWESDIGRLWRGDVPSADASGRGAALETKLMPPFALKPIDETYKETVERPLFVPSRRPAPPAAAAQQAAMKKGQFRLAGTSVSEGLSVAYLVELASNKTLRVTQGNEVNGIRLDSVSATAVVLKQGDETEELSLKTAASPKAPPPAAVSGAPNVAGTPAVPGAVATAVATPALPGVPGGNFGPPLPGAAAVVAAQPTGIVPGQNPQAAPRNPADAAAANTNNPNASNNPNDPAQLFRRRRFQNLPQ